MDLTAASGSSLGGRLTWESVRRRWPVVLVAALLAGALTGLALVHQGQTYVSTTDLLLNPITGLPYSPGARGERLENLITEIELVSSDEVAKQAKQAIGTTASLAALEKQVTVVNPPNSQVLKVRFAAGTPAKARAGSRAFAKAFLDYRKGRAQDSLDSRVSRLTDAITTNQATLTRTNKALESEDKSSAKYQSDLADNRAALTALSQLAGKVNDLRATDIRAGTVLSPPSPPKPTRSLPIAVLVLVGALVGAAAGLLLAAWRAVLDRRIYDVADIERLGIFVVGAVRRGQDRDGRQAGDLLTSPRADLADDVRIVRTVLAARTSRPTTLVLAPVAEQVRGNATTVAALAAALARSNAPVTLVDAGAGGFGGAALGPRGRGLSDVLLRGDDLGDVRLDAQPRLTLVPWGEHPEGADDLMSSTDLVEAVGELGRPDTWVLVASAPMSRPEALALVSAVGRVLLFVELGRTTLDELEHAVSDAQRCGVEIVGCLAEAPSGLAWVPTRGRGSLAPAAAAAADEQVGRVRLLNALGRDDESSEPDPRSAGTAAPPEPWPAVRKS